MTRALRKHWPVVAATLVLWLVLAGVLAVSVRRNGGLVYALDDTYIHMAVAKNLVHHGVFGVTEYEFSSSSSSLLWSLLLAATYLVTGVGELAPLVLNVASATLVVWCAYAFVRRDERLYGGPYLLLAVLAIAFITPLPALISTGMEHTLHALVSLVFVYYAAGVLSDDSFRWGKRGSVMVVVLAPLVTTARYEGVFLAFVVCCLLLLRGRFAYAVAVGAAALLPIGLYGAWSASQGSYWLPNSLMLKGRPVWAIRSVGALARVLYGAYGRFYAAPHLVVPTVLAVVGYVLRCGRSGRVWDRLQTGAVIVVATTALHVLLAGMGWFYRYEAYLVTLGLFVVAQMFWDRLPEPGHRPEWSGVMLAKGAGLAALAALAFLPLASRALKSVKQIPQVATVRRLHHLNAARFVARYYDDKTVVVNDLGAVTFFTNARVLDLYGLGSIRAMRLRKSPSGLSQDDVAAWAAEERASIAIVTGGFEPIVKRIPDAWVKVAEWRAPPSVVWAAEPSQESHSAWWVYAVEPAHAPTLAAQLEEYAGGLPAGVEQSILYPRP